MSYHTTARLRGVCGTCADRNATQYPEAQVWTWLLVTRRTRGREHAAANPTNGWSSVPSPPLDHNTTIKEINTTHTNRTHDILWNSTPLNIPNIPSSRRQDKSGNICESCSSMPERRADSRLSPCSKTVYATVETP